MGAYLGTARPTPAGSGCRTVETSTRWGVLSYLLREVVRSGGAARIARAQSHMPCEVVGGGGADRIPHARGPMSGDLLGRGTVPQPVVEVPLPLAGRRRPTDPRCGSPRPKRPAGSAFRQSGNRCSTGVGRRRPPPQSRRRPDPARRRPFLRAYTADRCTSVRLRAGCRTTAACLRGRAEWPTTVNTHRLGNGFTGRHVVELGAQQIAEREHVVPATFCAGDRQLEQRLRDLRVDCPPDQRRIIACLTRKLAEEVVEVDNQGLQAVVRVFDGGELTAAAQIERTIRARTLARRPTCR